MLSIVLFFCVFLIGVLNGNEDGIRDVTMSCSFYGDYSPASPEATSALVVQGTVFTALGIWNSLGEVSSGDFRRTTDSDIDSVEFDMDRLQLSKTYCNGAICRCFRSLVEKLAELIRVSRCLSLAMSRYQAAWDSGDTDSAVSRRNEAYYYCNRLLCLIEEIIRLLKEIWKYLIGSNWSLLDVTIADVQGLRDSIQSTSAFPSFEDFVFEAIDATSDETQAAVREAMASPITYFDNNGHLQELMCFCGLFKLFRYITLDYFKLYYIPTSFPMNDFVQSAWGDPYYSIALPNKPNKVISLKYDGPCQYLLLSNSKELCNNNQNFSVTTANDDIPVFSVITRHGRCGSRVKGIVCIVSTIITIGDNQFIVSKDNQIRLNGELILNDSEIRSFKTMDSSVIITIEEYSTKDIIYERYRIITNFGLILLVSQYNSGMLWSNIPNSLKSISCGVLTSIDKDSKYLITRNGNILNSITDENNINSMFDSWMIPYDNQPLICDLYPFTSYESSLKCINYNKTSVETICENMVSGNLNAMKGRHVTKCFDNNRDINGIDATLIYDNCITEICNCQSLDISKCEPKQSIQLWTQACKEASVDFYPLEWSLNF